MIVTEHLIVTLACLKKQKLGSRNQFPSRNISTLCMNSTYEQAKPLQSHTDLHSSFTQAAVACSPSISENTYRTSLKPLSELQAAAIKTTVRPSWKDAPSTPSKKATALSFNSLFLSTLAFFTWKFRGFRRLVKTGVCVCVFRRVLGRAAMHECALLVPIESSRVVGCCCGFPAIGALGPRQLWLDYRSLLFQV
mmetsp:Transcript_20806/g.33493  ORF Transcript_20806/g.33493 Transcript_20806/m.33493 type:complete len:194 (-) Transcript_20806:108-689(-)